MIKTGLLLLLLTSCLGAFAQAPYKKLAIDLGIGGSYAFGDVSSGIGYGTSLGFRYNINPIRMLFSKAVLIKD